MIQRGIDAFAMEGREKKERERERGITPNKNTRQEGAARVYNGAEPEIIRYPFVDQDTRFGGIKYAACLRVEEERESEKVRK